MARWLLKGCPKCGGDMLDEGEGSSCFQCGFAGFAQEAQPLEVEADGQAPGRRRHYLSRLDKQERDALMTQMYQDGVTQLALSQEFGISESMVSRLLKGTK